MKKLTASLLVVFMLAGLVVMVPTIAVAGVDVPAPLFELELGGTVNRPIGANAGTGEGFEVDDTFDATLQTETNENGTFQYLQFLDERPVMVTWNNETGRGFGALEEATVAMWVRMVPTPSFRGHMSWTLIDSQAFTAETIFEISQGGNNNFDFLPSGRSAIQDTPRMSIPHIPHHGQWRHTVFTRRVTEDGMTSGEMWINGVRQAEILPIPTTPWNVVDGEIAMFFGGSRALYPIQIRFAGAIAGVQVYDEWLTSEQIQAVFNAERETFAVGEVMDLAPETGSRILIEADGANSVVTAEFTVYEANMPTDSYRIILLVTEGGVIREIAVIEPRDISGEISLTVENISPDELNARVLAWSGSMITEVRSVN